MKLAVAIGKVVVLAAWFWGLFSFFAPTAIPAPELGRMVFLGLLAVHVAEALVFARRLTAEAGGAFGGHLFRILIFGYFHVLEVRYG
jgi:uncharacterized protein YhhL (DUF1145 family)